MTKYPLYVTSSQSTIELTGVVLENLVGLLQIKMM